MRYRRRYVGVIIMSRSARLLDLVQILRRHRQPVSGHALADELQISLRTLYRDINTLIGQGAPIEGEAGIGYVLKPGYPAAALDVRRGRDRSPGAGVALGDAQWR